MPEVPPIFKIELAPCVSMLAPERAVVILSVLLFVTAEDTVIVPSTVVTPLTVAVPEPLMIRLLYVVALIATPAPVYVTELVTAAALKFCVPLNGADAVSTKRAPTPWVKSPFKTMELMVTVDALLLVSTVLAAGVTVPPNVMALAPSRD